MSEQPTNRAEHLKPPEKAETAEHLKPQTGHAEKQPTKEAHEALANIHLRVEQEARPADEIVVEQGDTSEDQPRLIGKDLKAKALADILRQTRRHLTPLQRQFSKFIHASSVDKVSEGLAKTVARPTALMSGGLFALIGGLSLLFVSNHYGYEYRFSAFWLLLLLGFIVGLVIDLIFGRLRHPDD